MKARELVVLKHTVTILSVLIVTVFFSPTDGHALCSCAGAESAADTIFLGTVTSIRKDPVFREGSFKTAGDIIGTRDVATLQVRKSWHGENLSSSVTVLDSGVTSSATAQECNIGFIQGEDYLIFANQTPPENLTADLIGLPCAGTVLASQGDATITKLDTTYGAPNTPAPLSFQMPTAITPIVVAEISIVLETVLAVLISLALIVWSFFKYGKRSGFIVFAGSLAGSVIGALIMLIGFPVTVGLGALLVQKGGPLAGAFNPDFLGAITLAAGPLAALAISLTTYFRITKK